MDDMMEAALTEEDAPEAYRMPYDEMIAEYKRRIAELTDTGYQIKSPEEEEEEPQNAIGAKLMAVFSAQITDFFAVIG